jgi:uncharacterized membrane protein
MPADNVTPFRRPPKRPAAPQQSGGLGFKTHRGKAVLSQLLTVIAFAFNFAIPFLFAGSPLYTLGWIAGLAIAFAAGFFAYTNRGGSNPWANTHHEHALRTLIIGLAIWTLGSMLGYIHGALAVGTLIVQALVTLWAVIRAGIGMVLALMRKPIPNPRGWLI